MVVSMTLVCFNPRTPHGVRPAPTSFSVSAEPFQSTHPTRGATGGGYESAIVGVVSIHAPHTGCDDTSCPSAPTIASFNPRTPHGVRLLKAAQHTIPKKFQSTHPTRGATSCTRSTTTLLRFQSTHPTRGATTARRTTTRCDRFQSTHPTRGATLTPSTITSTSGCFNPRTPHGVRREGDRMYATIDKFQSTHPTRGATDIRHWHTDPVSFQSTHPTRGATSRPRWCPLPTTFQSTHPTRGATTPSRWTTTARWSFNPRTPHGVRLHIQ